MKSKLLIYGAVALATVAVALFLINGQTQRENAERAKWGAKPSSSTGTAFKRTFGQ